jgi:four helix bundle protein
MPKPDFEKLEVYRLAERLAELVWNIVTRWDAFTKFHVGGQLLRAADSIGANIAEGAGRGSFRENRRFVKIGRGSLNETIHFLRQSVRRKLINDEDAEQLRVILDELGPRLNAYLKSIGPRRRKPTTDNGQLTTDQ